MANEAARLMKEVSVVRSEEDMKIDDKSEEPTMDEEPVTKPANSKKPEEPSSSQPAPTPKEQTVPSPNKPAIDAKPTVRVRAPPGGKSSIFF